MSETERRDLERQGLKRAASRLRELLTTTGGVPKRDAGNVIEATDSSLSSRAKLGPREDGLAQPVRERRTRGALLSGGAPPMTRRPDQW